VRVYQIGLPAEKTNSLIVAKRKRTVFLTMLALFSLLLLLAPSLSAPLPTLLEDAAAQTPPEDCYKCIIIMYEGEDTAVIAGVENFANTTTRQDQYNSYLWQFINSLVSDGFEIKAVMMDDIRGEDHESTEDMYHVVLGMP
jgi:4-amino-4-deoxy-L-arabinose transferase-like glycosyltransferase